MSLIQRTIVLRNKRTRKPLALSTIRRRVVKMMKAKGYRIKRTGDLSKIVASR